MFRFGQRLIHKPSGKLVTFFEQEVSGGDDCIILNHEKDQLEYSKISDLKEPAFVVEGNARMELHRAFLAAAGAIIGSKKESDTP